jgi:hypothetical protein
MSLEQIADLTDFQILRVAYYPRDERGSLKSPGIVAPEQVQTPEDEKAVLFAFGSAMGIPHEELTRVWEEKRGKST